MGEDRRGEGDLTESFGYATMKHRQGHAFRVVPYDDATALPISGFDLPLSVSDEWTASPGRG